jgi:hypothetical protein
MNVNEKKRLRFPGPPYHEAGVPKTAAAMPIWLLCFIFNAVGHLSYSSYLLYVNGRGLSLAHNRPRVYASSQLF